MQFCYLIVCLFFISITSPAFCDYLFNCFWISVTPVSFTSAMAGVLIPKAVASDVNVAELLQVPVTLLGKMNVLFVARRLHTLELLLLQLLVRHSLWLYQKR